jgi:UDP-2,3-diacylglucosamine pyrophosphatase LpxH
MEFDTHFITQNIAPNNSYQIGVYGKDGKKKGYIPIESIAYPSDIGKKLYSFGALSDIHLAWKTADADFQTALTYFTEVEQVNFICICGDLTNYGKVSEYEHYQKMIDAYSPNTPVYVAAGNHDATHRSKYNEYTDALTVTDSGIEPYTGHPLNYTFLRGNDLFIMLGMRKWGYEDSTNTEIFYASDLQWLYDTLETNRNKRCFVWQHVLSHSGSGMPVTNTSTGLLESERGSVFRSIVQHYPNVIWFHGHSHACFESQEVNSIANYHKDGSCHSINISGLSYPREYYVESGTVKHTDLHEESEGYVVDVYEKYIVLRGRDFANEKFLPIANYCIDTTFTAVEEGTFTDSTGTIKT